MEKNGKRRVLLVDDHPIVRERLAILINKQEDLEVCGEADSAEAALKILETVQPVVAIIDISLRDSSGLSLIKDVRALYPAIAIIVLSMHDESLYAERVLRAGARGYLTKQEASDTILTGIRQVLAGHLYLSEKSSAELIHKHFNARSAGEVSEMDSLTDRELEVFEAIGHGKSTSQISSELHLSPKTVETYRARIKQKLKISRSIELHQRAVTWVESRGS